jgi:hypothetical protein
MNENRGSSNPIAVRKAGAARRERRHVKRPVTRYVQLHTKANNAARGEVLAVLGQATHIAAIPARPAARSATASRTIPNGLSRMAPPLASSDAA